MPSAYNPDNIFVLWQQQAALLGAPDQEIAKAQTEMAIARLITTYLAALVAGGTGGGSPSLLENPYTDDHILVLADADRLVSMTKGSANSLTVPPDADVDFLIGTQIAIIQRGAGETSIVAGSGVTIQSADGALSLTGQYATAALVKLATNTWLLAGSLV